MTTLLFVRHGETDWNRQGRFQGTRDIPLNDEGRAQARRLAARWPWGGDVLLSSPLLRARETAEILAPALGLTIGGFDPRLIERSYGAAEGLTLAERQAAFPHGGVPGVEAPEAIRARARAFLASVTEAYPGRKVVVVSHGGFINVILSLVSRGDHGTGKTLLGNTSVSEVRWSPRGWRTVSTGLVPGSSALGLKE